MRRAEPLHPAALLVDQDRRIRIFDKAPQFANEPSNLRRRIDVALEQDEAPRPFGADEFALGIGQFSPDTPVMNARLIMGPISPRSPRGSRKRPLIALDEALPAGSFQVAAELRGFVPGAERADHGAVNDALFAEIGALDHAARGNRAPPGTCPAAPGRRPGRRPRSSATRPGRRSHRHCCWRQAQPVLTAATRAGGSAAAAGAATLR